MQQTINMLEDLTTKYYQQEGILKQLQEADREFEMRLKQLEQRGMGSEAAPSWGSTAEPVDSFRKEALILGGWDADNLAADTLREAKTKTRCSCRGHGSRSRSPRKDASEHG